MRSAIGLRVEQQRLILTGLIDGQDVDQAQGAREHFFERGLLRGRLDVDVHQRELRLVPFGPDTLFLEACLQVAERQDASHRLAGTPLDHDIDAPQRDQIPGGKRRGRSGLEPLPSDERSRLAAQILDSVRRADVKDRVKRRQRGLIQQDVAFR